MNNVIGFPIVVLDDGIYIDGVKAQQPESIQQHCQELKTNPMWDIVMKALADYGVQRGFHESMTWDAVLAGKAFHLAGTYPVQLLDEITKFRPKV